MAERKLTLEQVAAARAAAGTLTIAELARRCGVSRNAMRDAVYGSTYRDCPAPPADDPGGDYKHPNRKLSDKRVEALREARRNGASLRALVKEYGVSMRSVQLIVSGEHYANEKGDNE